LNSLWSFKSCIFWWTTAFGDLQLLMRRFWWRHHFRRTLSSGALLTSGAVLFRCFKLPFLLIPLLSFVLPEPNDDLKFLSMVMYTWTNISISYWQFLIPCYHQNSQEVVLNTFCSNNASYPHSPCLLFAFVEHGCSGKGAQSVQWETRPCAMILHQESDFWAFTWYFYSCFCFRDLFNIIFVLKI